MLLGPFPNLLPFLSTIEMLSTFVLSLILIKMLQTKTEFYEHQNMWLRLLTQSKVQYQQSPPTNVIADHLTGGIALFLLLLPGCVSPVSFVSFCTLHASFETATTW